jgi:hypothetical protein
VVLVLTRDASMCACVSHSFRQAILRIDTEVCRWWSRHSSCGARPPCWRL